MRKRKSSRPRRATDIAHKAICCSPAAFPDEVHFIPGPKLRAKLGISAVTLWRWRHDVKSGFPPAKVINGRLYFSLDAVTAWLGKQPEAA